MRLLLWSCLAVALLAAVHSSADAYGCTSMWHCPPPPCCVKYQPKVVTSYRPEWREEKVPVVVSKVVHKHEAFKVKVQVAVPVLVDQQVVSSYKVLVPKTIERLETRCTMVATPVFDPCTCCCYMTFRPCCTTHKVRCTVMEARMETKVDVVKVKKMVMQDGFIDQVRTVPITVQEQAWTVRRTCVMVPCQTTVLVPVWAPCCNK